MSKILITGGAGFIGAHLTERLLSLGHKVLVVDLMKSQGGIPFVSKRSKLIKGNITNFKILKKIKKWKPSIIFHLAAQSAVETAYDDPKSDIMTNSFGTYLLCNLAKKIKVKTFIYTSTVAVYGNNPAKGVNENSQTNPQSLYGVSKLSGEMFVKQILNPTKTKTLIFRLFNTYGPGENLNNLKKGMVSIYCSYIWKKKPILVKGSLKRFRDLVYIKDCIDVLTKSISTKLRKKNDTFNLSSGENYSVNLLLKNIIQTSNMPKNYPIKVLKGTKDDSFGFHTSSKKIQKIFNFKPKYNLKKGLIEYFDWINKIPHNANLKNYHPLKLKR